MFNIFKLAHKLSSLTYPLVPCLMIWGFLYIIVGAVITSTANAFGIEISPLRNAQVSKWIGGLLALFIGYVLIKKNNSGNSNLIGETNPNTATGLKVKNAVFTLPTVSGPKQINITNPYRGILILGGAGAGKSKSFIEPIITQSIKNGFTGLLYDFKFPTLADITQATLMAQKSNLNAYYVNFDNLALSHRVNPLHPSTMPTSSHAEEYARSITANLMPESIKNPNFFSDSATNYLTAIIWYLREEEPQFCTLPHAVTLAAQDTGTVVKLLSKNLETSLMITSIQQAIGNNAGGQLSAVVGTLQNSLSKIAKREIFWVLSGNDFSLNINDPQDPKFVVLGNNPTLSTTYGPVLALLTTVAIKQMNQQNKRESVVILDEAPTLYIPNFEQIPATARSNKVATVFGAQDISQIEDMYGRSKKDALLSNLNNQFFGRVAHPDTAKYINSLWGKQDVIQVSTGQSEQKHEFGSASISQNQSYTQRDRVNPQDVLNLQTGEFFGQLVESDYSSFKAKIKALKHNKTTSLSPFCSVTSEQLKENFTKIHADIKSLLDTPLPVTQKASPKIERDDF